MTNDPSETEDLLHRAGAGDEQALAELFARYHDLLPGLGNAGRG